MDSYEFRLAIASDVAGLYDLLKEYVLEQELVEEFKNSRTSFEEHFNQVLFKALVIEVGDETENQRQIIGCIFFSIFYRYLVGATIFPHCCYIRPAFRNRGLEQKLIQHTKKMSRDADIDNMFTVLTPLNASYRKALENEGMINLTSSLEMDVWIMSNPPSTSAQKCDDYIIRDGTEQDLSNIYHLLEELIEMENLNAHFKVSKEEFERDGSVDKALYGSVIVEHCHRVEDQDEESEVVHDIVGCLLYSKMYYALIGQTYLLQGIYLKPAQKGKGLGKALLRATLQACKKRSGDGFIMMIHHENKTSQSLVRSLHGINLTQSTHIEWIKALL